MRLDSLKSISPSDMTSLALSGSEQNRSTLSLRYQLKFSSTTLNIKIKSSSTSERLCVVESKTPKREREDYG